MVLIYSHSSQVTLSFIFSLQGCQTKSALYHQVKQVSDIHDLPWRFVSQLSTSIQEEDFRSSVSTKENLKNQTLLNGLWKLAPVYTRDVSDPNHLIFSTLVHSKTKEPSSFPSLVGDLARSPTN